MRWLIAGLLAVTTLSTTAHATSIKAKALRVADDAGVQVYVRNKHPENVTKFAPDRIAIMMHGATYPATAFDLPLAGKSWVDYMGERGFDVYALDLPGYGRSTRPAAMDQPPTQSAPVMRTPHAGQALGAGVDFVRARRGVGPV